MSDVEDLSGLFLPGVPVDHVVGRLSKAGGQEITSGKLHSPESSAALAINTFGWFVERPEQLPPFPNEEPGEPAPTSVEVEYCARFPWSGGRHPWLDAAVERPTSITGVESKRFEPFRDRKLGSLSTAYDRPVWGSGMTRFERLRDDLRSGAQRFEYLDAVQLLKHAFGLVTEGGRKGKQPRLVYIFAEPVKVGQRLISPEDTQKHRAEIERFSASIRGDDVRFTAFSYQEWLATWPTSNSDLLEHRQQIIERFDP